MMLVVVFMVIMMGMVGLLAVASIERKGAPQVFTFPRLIDGR